MTAPTGDLADLVVTCRIVEDADEAAVDVADELIVLRFRVGNDRRENWQRAKRARRRYLPSVHRERLTDVS